MSIGREIAYRRSARGKDATGSLLFDTERERARMQGENADRKATSKRPKQPIG